MSQIWSDLKIALRSLLKRPGQTALAAAALSLGLGLVCTQYSFISGVMLKGLPAPRSTDLFYVERINQETKRAVGPMPAWEYLAYREQQSSFDDLLAVSLSWKNVSGGGVLPRRADGCSVTSSAFKLLSASAEHGRVLLPSDDAPGAPHVALVSHNLWREVFGADPAAVGRQVRINGESATLVGVMPQGFHFPVRQDVWTNLRPEAELANQGWETHVDVVGMLKQGVSKAAAAAEVTTIASRLAAARPDTNKDFTGARLVAYTERFTGEEAWPIFMTMLASVVGVLLISCANVTNLLLARAAERGKEMAIRSAIGASRKKIAFQMLTESLALAALGAVGGIGLTFWGVDILTKMIAATNPPYWFKFTVDGGVLAVSLTCTVAAGLLAGALPSWQVSRVDLNELLKDGARGASGLRIGRFGRLLVIAQVAVSCALMVATGIMALGVVKSRHMELPFDSRQILAGSVELFGSEYPEEADRVQFYEALRKGASAIPGVESASLSSRVFGRNGVLTDVEIQEQPKTRDYPRAWMEVVSPEYFNTLSIGLTQGRHFTEQDDMASPPVAIVNQSFARRHWGAESPLGKRFRRVYEKESVFAEVVGVVPDLHMEGFGNRGFKEGFYMPQRQQAWGWMTLYLKSQTSDVRHLANPLRELMRGLAPDQPLSRIQTLAEVNDERLAVFGMISRMFVCFGGAAMFLAAVGIYGVVSFNVNQRAREFGIRMALGARAPGILGLVVRQGSAQLGVGLAAGILLSFGLTKPMSSFLPGVEVFNLAMHGGVTLFIGLISMAAIFIPSLRATRVDPVTALRRD